MPISFHPAERPVEVAPLATRSIYIRAALLLAGMLCSAAPLAAQADTATVIVASRPRTMALVGGRWLERGSFRSLTRYAVNGVLTRSRPAVIDTTIDLHGGFVIPPLADAHTHMFDAPYAIAEQSAAYLRDGVFYVAVVNNGRRGAAAVANRVNIPGAIDAAYAHGGLTGDFSHPIDTYEALALGIRRYDEQVARAAEVWKSRRAEGNAYHIIRDSTELSAKWPRILDGRPDLIKVFLRRSERYASRRDFVPTTFGRLDGGLDPTLVPAIVRRASQAGLRVFAAVSSAADFRVAVAAGVANVTHFPGYQSLEDNNAQIARADAVRAAASGMSATLITSEFTRADRDSAVAAMERVNLATLRAAKVRVAIGSDAYGESIVPGLIAMCRQGTLSPSEALRWATEVTATVVFPKRRIGKLEDGYEASFLVLPRNPLTDIGALRDIRLRVKSGAILTLSP